VASKCARPTPLIDATASGLHAQDERVAERPERDLPDTGQAVRGMRPHAVPRHPACNPSPSETTMILQAVHRIVLTAAITVSALTLGAVGMARLSADDVRQADERRYLSYLLADELRQSSDDLTRLARTYVVDGDPKWERQYFEVLDIRNGKLPRPANYERIYWDLRAADTPGLPAPGEAVPLLDLMKRAGFSEGELAKLAEAKANSDDLVRTETVAMNLVKGLYDDGNGQFTRKGEPDLAKARALMHDQTYHRHKAKIMVPVNEFLAQLDLRTEREVAEARSAESRWALVAMALSAGLAAVVIAGLVALRRRTVSVFAEVSQAAQRIAQGDLHIMLGAERTGDEGRLRDALSDMQSRLGTLVSTVRTGADSLATASSQISQGNNDLSLRTETQAGNLQQTAASMHQLTSTVAGAANTAREANDMANSAAEAARQGGDVVGQVVSTMQDIAESSRRIADIIGVIDGIAFQTNILALNAAVEAARAGEQGRGFAVVASEVRSLAGRSAEAAREIKQLISASVARVEAGSQQVDLAGASMRELVARVERVSQMIGELSNATVEQSAGIGQVSESVQHLDQATQQNAALVEQSAAAAESLHQQAATLFEAVRHFRVADTQPAPLSGSARALASA